MSKLTLTVDFKIGNEDEKDSYKLGGSVKQEGAAEIIENWLRSQMGAGPDGADPNRQDFYHIEIDWDPAGDVFTARSDCGNKGLRDGLLMYVFKELTKKE